MKIFKSLGLISFTVLAIALFQNCSGYIGETLNNGEGVIQQASSSSACVGPSCETETSPCLEGANCEALPQPQPTPDPVCEGTDCRSACEGAECAPTCTFDGAVIPYGGTVFGYRQGQVPYGQSCEAEMRVCGFSGLSGSAPYASCSVQEASPCLVAGLTIPHGGSRTMYTSSSVPYGSSCSSSQTSVSCNNGVPSKTSVSASCSVSGPSERWVSRSGSETHGQTCSRVGMVPATNRLGYGICASGEARPTQGIDFDKISYPAIWGGVSQGGTIITGTSPYLYCYRNGQKMDNDPSDLLVAYLCM
ncbi:MAG: hypothetical protein GW917_02830 [Bdellovibrionales bacterium]|nr:hypothetical protein [Bdellovibrionales bacterium]